ncbi:MAG: AMP-binding protein [Eggerthellaceae bacterium]|nr:AMP-binding protein [Eggerthellaceae bacterium]
MGRCALVTGGSGFLGGFVVRGLLEAGFEEVLVLMRGERAEEARARLRALWWERPELSSELGGRIRVVCGDICEERLGLTVAEYEELARSVTHIVHAAAEIGVNETARRFGEVNVDGTCNALLFAGACVRAGKLQRFVHVSTAYVAGVREGVVREDELIDSGFNSLYEQSKYGAEQLVRDAMARIPACVVRPAQIVGDSETGFAATFNTLYYPLKLYLKGKLPVVPVPARQKLNMVPVDFVANMVVRALVDPCAAGKTYHAVIPAEFQPTVGEMLAFVRAWAKGNLDYDPGAPLCVPVPLAADAGRRRNMASSSAPKPKGFAQNMLALAPYFSERRTYDTENARALMGGVWPDWRDYLPRLLAYATCKGFLNHTGRTVFQQMLVRLSSDRNTITYYDVSREGIARTDSSVAADAILRVAAALQARGIGSGDRVVLVGVNSTRYFIADAAVGLVSAVSVPLYYTSPVSDIVELARDSGAKLAFVGTRALQEGLPGRLDVPMVSLLEGQPPDPIVGWDDFLGSVAPLERPPAVALDDVATIRCTSGTTGKPKGVVFDQYQLRWMGEVMPALLDWRTRNGDLRYLSFLPMSHVVEGILVAYAPYYILSDIEMYYLNDFGALVDALPKVRPTLFFSVPRFYEKVWNQFAATGAGRFWIALPDGVLKRVVAWPLRHVVLRKAGLDKCRQLIVGSAPIGMELLESFRSLGVEIHNAFGVTEAPLITLSRLGSNELGSVGALLPNTEARIGDDGQVYIRGPQVTRGYDGAPEPAVDADGWFCTGDLAHLSEAGNLVLNGRKKEILVTSYGKNIAPQKVEVLLKGIDGVSEAMVVADSKPFVTALIWLEDDAEGCDFAALDSAVIGVNEQLSHPEQVKRWIVAARPLSLADGELTPNLKVRRNVVAETRAPLVEALYDGWGEAGGVVAGDELHRGEAS